VPWDHLDVVQNQVGPGQACNPVAGIDLAHGLKDNLAGDDSGAVGRYLAPGEGHAGS
jgi:hypothetical protein